MNKEVKKIYDFLSKKKYKVYVHNAYVRGLVINIEPKEIVNFYNFLMEDFQDWLECGIEIELYDDVASINIFDLIQGCCDAHEDIDMVLDKFSEISIM